MSDNLTSTAFDAARGAPASIARSCRPMPADGLPLPIAISYRDRGFFRSVTATGTFDMFVCASCGFTELWANEVGELRSNPEEGVHFIDGGGTDAPYR